MSPANQEPNADTPIPLTTPPSPARPGVPSWLGPAAMAVYAVVAWVYLLAFPGTLALPALDPSWEAILALAGAEHWEFGRQIVANYGPWAHLGIGFFYSPLFTTDYVFQIISKAVLVALICRTGRALPPVARAAFLLANLLTGILEWETIHLLAVVYTGWLLSEDRTRAGRIIGGAGVVLVAAMGLIKTFYVVFGLAVFGCVLARHVLRGRGSRASWQEGLIPLAGFLSCLGLDWKLAGQAFDDLPVYARGALEMMDGHSRAMGMDTQPLAFRASLAALAVTGGLGVAAFLRGERRQRMAMLPLAALFAGNLFMAWKQGFTRADEFHVSGYLWFIVTSVTALPLFFDRRALAPVWHGAGVGVVVALAAVAVGSARPTQFPHLVYELRTRPGRNLRILFDPAIERARLDDATEHLRVACDLPRTRAAVGRASIDLFGTSQDLLLHNGLRYTPVPTLQGFIAYTPYLAALAARGYAPDRAPEFVLFQGGSIDDRWPSLDGAAQLREILCNYQSCFAESGLLLLKRKSLAECVPTRPVLQQQGEIALDTDLPLPADGADWCELEVHRTLLGRLINFFYHEPALTIEATTVDGRSGRWKLPPVMAQGGFLLRQGPQSLGDVSRLLAGGTVAHPIASVRLGGDRLLRWAIQGRVSYRFYKLNPPSGL